MFIIASLMKNDLNRHNSEYFSFIIVLYQGLVNHTLVLKCSCKYSSCWFHLM